MSRPWKIVLGALGVLIAVALVLTTGGYYVAQSDWLRETIRHRIVSNAERATGGRIEIGRFLFDWKALTAELDDFTIHGTEPAESAPLLKVRKIVAGLKIVSLADRDIDVAYVRVESPSAVLLIAEDGSTNVPSPKMPAKSGKTAMEEILNLKIGDFSIENGSIAVHAAGSKPRIASYELTGRNLQSKLNYQAQSPKYSGRISIQPLDLRYDDYRQVQASVDASFSLERNRLQVSAAKIGTAASRVELSGDVTGFAAPVITGTYDGELSLQELASILKLKTRPAGIVHAAGTGRYAGNGDYVATGKFQAKNVSYAPLGSMAVEADFHADPNRVELTALRCAALGGMVTGRATLRDFDRYEFSGAIVQFGIARLAALETSRKLPYDGIVEGKVSAAGWLSDPQNRRLSATAQLNISPAPAGIPLTGEIDARYDGEHGQIALAPSHLALPHTRLSLNGVLGARMQVLLESRDLDDLLPATALAGQKTLPVTLNAGSVRFDGSVIGPFQSPRLEGHVSGTNFVYADQPITSLTADVTAQETGLSLRRASLVFHNLRAAFQVSVGLRNWKVDDAASLSANGTLQNASVSDLLALAGRKDIPVTGTMTATAQFAGTVGNPQAAASLTAVNGSAYSEPFDRITAKVEYVNGGAESIAAQWKAGVREIGVNARYQHSPGDARTGLLHFQAATNRMSLAQFANVKKREPGLAGSVTVNAAGDLSIARSGAALTALNGDARAAGITLDGRAFGDYDISAQTAGRSLKLHLESNLAHAVIGGDGTFELAGNYPGSARIAFSKLDLGTARKMLLPAKGAEAFAFAGSAEGSATITGALLKPEAMTASLEIPQFELRPEANAIVNKEIPDLTIRNTQPIRFSLANSLVRVESARFTGLNTDVSLLGSIDLKQKEALNLNLNGNVDLKLARTFNPDIESSGNLLVRVTMRGLLSQPQLGGSADLRNGNLSMAGFPNGLSKANGRILFDENRATIETLSAQTGGGTVKLDGFAAFGGPFVSFRLGATATAVRVRYPEGVSSVSDANLTWTGSTERSVLGGDVTVHKVAYNQQSDLGSVLSLAGGPAPTQSAPTGLLGGTQFDVRVQTAPDITLQTGLVAGLQTVANLRLRGTAANPSLLGRIVIDSGTLNFLGNKYLINEGTISFYNPVKIEPIVNIDLETQARGVDVTLSVSGPLNKLNVTYRSDPPLQFSDIVGLLATGKTPSDPTIAARQTDTQQSWEQLGASALVGQAIANPVSGRLQRFFGVSRLKIDPLLPGLGGAGESTGGANPGARLSLEQQVTPNVIFDYVISTNSTSSQIVRVEWAFSKHWSAVILREENSAFGIDFQYKKRFK